MKQIIILLGLLAIAGTGTAQGMYNKRLADSLGADEYGMKMYSLVLLKTGSFKTEDKQVTDSLFRGHMDNINHLAKSGKLLVAGPMGENKDNYRGIFILNANTPEEAKLLLAKDPAIAAQYFSADIYPWYGSAALPMYLPFHDQIEKKKP